MAVLTKPKAVCKAKTYDQNAGKPESYGSPAPVVRRNQRNKPDGPLSVAERNRVLEEWLAEHPRPILLMQNCHPRLVRTVKSGCRGLSDDEANQLCLLGAVQAARLFDPARRVKFWTFARWHMRAVLVKHVRRAMAEFRGRGGDLGTLDEHLTELDGYTLASGVPDRRLTDPAAAVLAADLLEQLAGLVSRVAINERHRLVIGRRWGLDGRPPASLKEIGKEMGVTRERIRQIEVKVLKKVGPELTALLNQRRAG